MEGTIRDKRITIRVNATEKEAIKDLCKKYACANASELLRLLVKLEQNKN